MRTCAHCGNPLGRSGYQKVQQETWIHKACYEAWRESHPDYVDVWLKFYDSYLDYL